MRRQSMSNTEAIVAQGLRPPCPGEPFGAKPMYVPIEDTRYVSPRASSNGVGNETPSSPSDALQQRWAWPRARSSGLL